jgi:hypothetical protein
MIVYFSHCPYCNRGHIGVDCDRPALIFNPDSHDARPCPHLACLHGALQVMPANKDSYAPVPSRSGEWLWLRERIPLGALPDQEVYPDLLNYLLDIALDELPHPCLMPPRPFRIVGGTAGQRDARRPGSGEVLVSARGGEPLVGTLDAWAYYAPDPLRFVDALPGLLRKRDRMLRT